MLSTGSTIHKGAPENVNVLSKADQISLQNLFDQIAERGHRFRTRKAALANEGRIAQLPSNSIEASSSTALD